MKILDLKLAIMDLAAKGACEAGAGRFRMAEVFLADAITMLQEAQTEALEQKERGGDKP